jgi:hypothetical protein
MSFKDPKDKAPSAKKSPATKDGANLESDDRQTPHNAQQRTPIHHNGGSDATTF